MRIDRPVAELAVSSGRRILLVAALETALQQTLALLKQVASAMQRSNEVVEVPCSQAWAFFESGNLSGYLAEIANSINSTAVSGDLVLLAQASMAPAAELVARQDITIFSSPEPGVAAAIAHYRHRRLASRGTPARATERG